MKAEGNDCELRRPDFRIRSTSISRARVVVVNLHTQLVLLKIFRGFAEEGENAGVQPYKLNI